MRDKLELYCKALGVTFICWGILQSISFIPVYFNPPKANMVIPESMSNTPMGQQMSRDVDSTFPKLYAWITVQMFIQGLFPALLGWYLTRSNNLFVNLCYPCNAPPTNNKNAGAVELNVPKQETSEQPKPQGDERFAPPGYHQ